MLAHALLLPVFLLSMLTAPEPPARSGPENGGLQIGEKAPPITRPDVDGRPVDWDALLKKGPVVVVFYRGSWCPFCNVYLASLVKELPEIQKYATIIAITPQKPDKIEVTKEKKNITFPLVYDENSAIVRAYRSVSEKNEVTGRLAKDYDSSVLPVPATYVIGRDGTVVDRHFDENYKARMDIKALLETLKKL